MVTKSYPFHTENANSKYQNLSKMLAFQLKSTAGFQILE